MLIRTISLVNHAVSFSIRDHTFCHKYFSTSWPLDTVSALQILMNQFPSPIRAQTLSVGACCPLVSTTIYCNHYCAYTPVEINGNIQIFLQDNGKVGILKTNQICQTHKHANWCKRVPGFQSYWMKWSSPGVDWKLQSNWLCSAI